MSGTATAIAIDRGPGEIRAVALDAAGRLVDLALERPGGPTEVGDLHRGRVTARVPALGGAFVALVGADGFLPDSAGGREATEGMVLAVRVVRAAQGGKGPRLAVAAADPGPGPPMRLATGPGAVARLAALHPAAVAREGWSADIAEQVAALAEAAVALPGGGRMTITPTPALVAIDVDLGGLAAGRSDKARAHLAANAGWLPELALQIRLRNLGGGIVVDFAGLSARRRAAFAPGLAEALAADPMQPRLLGFTGLGFAEILRSRGHAPLHELLAGPHAAVLAAARALARERHASPSLRLGLRLGPAVLDAFLADRALQGDLRASLGEAPRIRADPSLPTLGWAREEL